MILDACVLIDFIKSDRSVLKRVNDHVGQLYATSAIIDEVNDIEDENELDEYGLILIEPEMEDAIFAGSQSPGPLSFADWLCLLTAKRHGFICVTNDTCLRRGCKRESVPSLWGLELILELHKAGGISTEEAESVARSMQQTNPRFMHARLVAEFFAKLHGDAGKKPRK
jgi:hypothetical protein